MSEITRDGNFSSSEIWKLTKKGRGKSEYFGEKALTYIEEKKMEYKLGRALSVDHSAKPTNWGTLVEAIGFSKIDNLEYSLVSKKRYQHPEINRWVGVPDIVSTEISGDIKCPWTMKSFCQLVDSYENGPESLKEASPEYYWQLVSNCILTGKPKAALIVYCPYLEDLEEIRRAAIMNDDETIKTGFLEYCSNNELPYLIKGNHYSDVNEIVFEVPKADKDFLTERVLEAVKLLENA